MSKIRAREVADAGRTRCCRETWGRGRVFPGSLNARLFFFPPRRLSINIYCCHCFPRCISTTANSPNTRWPDVHVYGGKRRFTALPRRHGLWFYCRQLAPSGSGTTEQLCFAPCALSGCSDAALIGKYDDGATTSVFAWPLFSKNEYRELHDNGLGCRQRKKI